MLPFLKPKLQTGVIEKTRPSDSEKHEENQDVSEIEALETCAEDIIRSASMKDAKRLAAAIKDMHDVLHSYMDSDSEDYDSQNEKAAEGNE